MCFVGFCLRAIRSGASFLVVCDSSGQFFGSCFISYRMCLFYSGAVHIFLCQVADIALKLKSDLVGATVCCLKRCKHPTMGIGAHKASGLGVGVFALDVCRLSFLLRGGRNFCLALFTGGCLRFACLGVFILAT